MAKRRIYAPEFREQMVELVRVGRTPDELAKEFEPSAQTIRNWLKQADLDAGRRTDGRTTQEQDELKRLRRENKQLRLEREIRCIKGHNKLKDLVTVLRQHDAKLDGRLTDRAVVAA